MSSSRKLVRSVSTCAEDMIDDALNELNHLNQRHALRQQWLRKNVKHCTYRRSGSLSSNSSSCGSSSQSQSSSSSFSSSLSTTLSSSESWDSFSDADVSMSSRSSLDYPRVRRLSKPKLNLYRPYSKPRRFSLQLVSHPESPEIIDDLSFSNLTINPIVAKWHQLSGGVNAPKYSRLVSAEKENCNNMKVKSNPTSPSKYESLTAAVLLDSNMFHSSNSSTCTTCSLVSSLCCHTHPQFTQSSTGVLQVRSKSLDDLTCIGVSNVCCTSNEDISNNSNATLFPKQSIASASSCDIDNVLQRISTLQV